MQNCNQMESVQLKKLHYANSVAHSHFEIQENLDLSKSVLTWDILRQIILILSFCKVNSISFINVMTYIYPLMQSEW